MTDLFSGGFFGAVLGGVFRLFPVVVQFFDKKNEREHEFKMFNAQVELEKTKGEMKLDEIRAQRDASVDGQLMDAVNASIKQQADMVRHASRWVANFSAMIRPGMTVYILAMYGAVKFSMIYMMILAGVPGPDAVVKNWGAEDMALLLGIVNYWLLDRSLSKRGL